VAAAAWRYDPSIDEVMEEAKHGSAAKLNRENAPGRRTGIVVDASNKNCGDVQSGKRTEILHRNARTRKIDEAHRLINVGFFEN
jgi:hypothetical protein